MTSGAVAGLVLAAGESRRMRADKALLAYHGKPFLEVILENLRQAGIRRRAVVLGHHATAIQNAVNFGDASVVINENFHLGQTSSLQAGLRVLSAAESEGIMLCLVDHPACRPETMRQLVEAFLGAQAPVVIPVYSGRRGHPAVLGRMLFEELLGIDSGLGADAVVRKYRSVTRWVEVDDPGVVMDIDDPRDYQDLISGAQFDGGDQ